jgi:hypothetical protein
LAERLVRFEAKPAGRGAVPGDDIRVRIGKKLRGIDHLVFRELVEILLGKADLGDAETGEVRTYARYAGEHLARHGLQHRVGRRGQHTETNIGHVRIAHASLA